MIEALDTGRILFPDGETVRAYVNPLKIIAAFALDEVQPALLALEAQVAEGRHVAGYIAYEASGAFDHALQTHPPGPLPLLWFGVYEEPAFLPQPYPSHATSMNLQWTPCRSKESYLEAVTRIHEHIGAGDTYQVNFTFPVESQFSATPETWFWERLAAQENRYGAFLDLGTHKIMSLSPELFFELEGDTLTTRPMKGTRPRGFTREQDSALASDLAQSPKDQAENLMIVDMLRNDLGRICDVNSIDVPALFSVERYPTVWQMTSTITGKTQVSLPEIIKALFPSASVTGAPKVETMKLIRQLETGPRGVYCGAIGWWAPGRQARFNVAIRTATLDAHTRIAHFPAGSGITWDSNPEDEYDECLHKTAVLHHYRPAFSIISALRLEATGYTLLQEHLERLESSANYFDYRFERATVESALARYSDTVEAFPAKVRIAIARDGRIDLSHERIGAPKPWRIGLALQPIDPCQPWLYHKTTHRTLYDEARESRPDCDAVVLWTPGGTITEANTANIVLQLGEERATPPVKDGLLGGVFRRSLLESGAILERPLTLDDLARADKCYLINSVRGWIETIWVHHPEAPKSLQDIR